MVNFLIFYGISSFIFLVLMRKKVNWIVQVAFIVFIPFFGMILILYLCKNRKEAHALPDWLIQKMEDDQEEILQADQNPSVGKVIPFQDALIFNDNQFKRKMLLDILKKESVQNVTLLRAALENEDTETSHFAATAIMDTKSKLGDNIQEIEIELEQDPYNIEKLITFSDLLYRFLEIELVDHQTRRKYLYQYTNILERIIEVNPFNPSFLIKKIDCDLELGEYQNASYYCEFFREHFPDNEDSYFQSMKLYYNLQDEAGFLQALALLKNSPIKLSEKGLNKLQFWIQGEEHDE